GDDGATWECRGARPVAARIEPGGPADLAGVRIGDQLVELGEVAPSPTRSVRELLWGRPGVPTPYRLRRENELLEMTVVPRAGEDENRLYYFLFVVGAAALSAGTLTLLKLDQEPAAAPLFGMCLALFAVLAFSPGGGGGPL